MKKKKAMMRSRLEHACLEKPIHSSLEGTQIIRGRKHSCREGVPHLSGVLRSVALLTSYGSMVFLLLSDVCWPLAGLAKDPIRKFCDASTNGVNFCAPSRSEKLHIWGMSSSGYELLQLIMVGKVAGKRRVGLRESGLKSRVQ
ncbi:jg22370 [Pararge aegeria aegeria]|uniref:Jg22370 protein n=1 Tax=Pararge aegeria aegeria TaxID=348720 RepID=A0A8S4QX44_9NEOP|nr:jg22370 [Pararge aegeria aegeria]